ncbi:MAG: hypothetical protein WCZ98_00975 [Sideroxydans sp.]
MPLGYPQHLPLLRGGLRCGGERSLSPQSSPASGRGSERTLREFHICRTLDISTLPELDDARYDALQPVQWPVNSVALNGTQRLFADGKLHPTAKRAWSRLHRNCLPWRPMATSRWRWVPAASETKGTP